MAVTATITSRGQITPPRDVRKALGSNTVKFRVDGETVMLMPVRSVAGVLGRYAGKNAPFKKVREKSGRRWPEAKQAETLCQRTGGSVNSILRTEPGFPGQSRAGRFPGMD